MEFTNGNYYLVDILEIDLLAEEIGNVYHSYVKINYSVQKLVQLLTGMTNRTIETLGVPFRNVIEFISDVNKHTHVDSMQNLKDAGYRRPRLDALCAYLKIGRRGHPALDDAKILKTVCTMKLEEMLQNPHGYTFIDIISYLNAKLPIPLQRVYGLANRCTSHAELEDILYGYARPKTS